MYFSLQRKHLWPGLSNPRFNIHRWMRAKKFRASCCGFLPAPHFKGHTSWAGCVFIISYVARKPNIDFYVRFM